nr:MAG TPA: hypothetical protein [Caudoviricetes sp.]
MSKNIMRVSFYFKSRYNARKGLYNQGEIG